MKDEQIQALTFKAKAGDPTSKFVLLNVKSGIYTAQYTLDQSSQYAMDFVLIEIGDDVTDERRFYRKCPVTNRTFEFYFDDLALLAGKRVYKYGHVSKVTYGTLAAPRKAFLNIRDEFYYMNVLEVRFDAEQSGGDAFAIGGDSGSPVCLLDGEKAVIVGTIWREADDRRNTYIVPIQCAINYINRDPSFSSSPASE